MSNSIQAIVKDTMSLYDHNRNGVIDLNKTGRDDETIRTETHVRGAGGRGGGDVWTETRAYSDRKLFEAADAKHDGKVTPQELEQFIRKFDTDNDGKLSHRGFFGWLLGKPKQEGDKFDDQYGEKLIGTY